MPTIYILESIKILIFFDDHYPKHFHVYYNEYEELIEIDSLTIYRGKIPAKQRKKVIKWANENKNYIKEKWDEFNPDKK